MNNSIKIIFAFSLGVVTGVVTTQRFFKTKYEVIAQEEIDSVKEVYSKKETTNEPDIDSYIPIEEDEDEDEYKTILINSGYSNYEEKKGGSEPMKNDVPYVIPPDEFGNDDEYDLIGLTYYANGVLTDDGDYPIEDTDLVVGPEALKSFGEYEEDTVYVKNDERKCYYEICRDPSEYSGPRVFE